MDADWDGLEKDRLRESVLHEARHEYGRDPNLPPLSHVELPYHWNGQIEDIKVQNRVKSALGDCPSHLVGTSFERWHAAEGLP